MATHSIHRVQQIPVSLEKAWDYFANPANLGAITPEYMDFKTISKFHGDRIYPGQIIEYKVRPVWNIQVYWMTEIVHVKDQVYFVDEQRRGPYRLWHHQHHFKAIEDGVEMTDLVHYQNPGWIFEGLADRFFVRKKLEGIFDYRYKKIEEMFGKWPL